MKFVTTQGVRLLSSSLIGPGRPDVLSAAEKAAWLTAAGQQCATSLTPAQQVSIPDGVPTNFQWLWDWTGAATQFMTPRPEPILGMVISISVADLQLVIGSQFSVQVTYAYHPLNGYGGAPATPPGSVVTNYLFEFERPSAGSLLIGLLPAYVLNGRPTLALPFVGTSQADSTLTIQGIPANTTMRMRLLQKFDPAMVDLWPDAAGKLLAAA